MCFDDPRVRLLEAAGEIFAMKGFKGGTVREIVQRAGVNIAAVNYYFRDKEGLYVEAVKAAFGPSQDVGLLDWPANTPPEVKLADFIRFEVLHILDSRAPAWRRQLVLQELIHPTPFCADVIAGRIRPRAKQLDGILQELLPRLPEDRRNLIAHSIVGQYVFHRLSHPILANLVGEEEYRSYDTERLAEHIIEFSMAALGLRPPVGSDKGLKR